MKDIQIDLDKDIIYSGDTEKEKELSKQLLETTLELNSYQDSYDVMHDILELRTKLDEVTMILYEEYIPEHDRHYYSGYKDAIEWALNNSETQEEKLSKLPKASKEQVTDLIKELNSSYKQLSIFDLGVEDENN